MQNPDNSTSEMGVPVEGVSESDCDGVKQKLAQAVFEKLKSSDGLLKKVKWSLDFKKRKGNEVPWSQEAARDSIVGNLVGFVAEAVAEKVHLTDAEVVYNPKGISLESLRVISPQEFAGSSTNKKGDVMSHLLSKSLEEKPLKAFDPKTHLEDNPMLQELKEGFKFERAKNKSPEVSPAEYKKQFIDYIARMRETVESQFVKGYTWGEFKEKDKSVTPSGEFFAGTVFPDGVLTKDGEPVGVFEVKAVSSEELAKAMSLIRKSGKEASFIEATSADFGRKYLGSDKEKFKIGPDIGGEIGYLDVLRSLTGRDIDTGFNDVFLLMFTNDAPNNLLNQYGEMISSHPYKNVVVQERTFDVYPLIMKLPLSRDEIITIAKEVIKAKWGTLSFQLLEDSNFKNRDIEVLHQFAFDEN